MAGNTTYVDPSAYQQEVIVPNGINIPAQPFAVTLVGVGSRNKRVTNEAVLRGSVTGESVTPAAISPHTAVLANRASRTLDTTTVYKTLNGIQTVIADQYVTFEPAYVLGTVTGTADLSTNNAFALEMDGEDAITLVLHDVPAATAPASNAVFTFASGIVTLSIAGQTFLTNGVRPGTTITLATSEDVGNDGTFTVLTVPNETTVTFANATGVANADDDTVIVTFSGTGRVGREVHVLYDFAVIGAATMTEVAAAVNQGLAASTTLGYGASYSAVATISSSALLITSPLDTSLSDVRVFAPIATSALVSIFGVAGNDNRDARTRVTVDDLVWSASATWAVDYVRVSDDTDPLANTDIQRIVAVGSTKGSTSFYQSEDWQLTSDEVDWTPDAAAVLTGIAGAAAGNTFDVSTADQLVLNADGLLGSTSGTIDITVDLNGLLPAPLGYVNPAAPATATATELATNINAVLASELGPRYASVASAVTVSGTPRVRLTSPTEGRAGSYLAAVAAAANSAHTAVFGAEVEALGTGKRPAAGTVYFVTYEYTRPASDYDVPFRHFSVESARAQVGQASAGTAGYNPLAIAAELAFENGSQVVYTVQVDDTSEGNPTRNEVKSALDGAAALAGCTEIVVVGEPGTRLVVKTDMTDHLETQNTQTEKHPRRAFYGMASGTAIGDRDTVDSIVGAATRTLQVAATSPARGRMFLLAPPQLAGVTRDQKLDDGSTVRISLDATYLGVATAARRTSLQSPSDTLTRRTITGFNIDDITAPWKPAERRAMASQGVCVVTLDGGRLLFLDAMTTEGGGGNLTAFKVDSTSYQKDVVVTKVNQALDANIVGIVPFDLASFILDIKLIIQGVVSSEISKGTIGPFRDENGAIRSIDLRTDIRVVQAENDPTEYDFNYWFTLRYPALRLFGLYSVDSPFFGLTPA